MPGLAVYGATKHAVMAFTTSLQGDLLEAKSPIRVHALCPDAAATTMVHDVADQDDAAILFSSTRLLTADEVADAGVALLDGTKIVKALPNWRGWMIRGSYPFPRAGLHVLHLFRRIGDRRRPPADEISTA